MTCQYKTKKKHTKNIVKMSKINNYITFDLLDSVYFKKNNKLIAVDLSKQIKLKDSLEINFIGKFERDEEGIMFFIIEKSGETAFEFLQNSVGII